MNIQLKGLLTICFLAIAVIGLQAQDRQSDDLYTKSLISPERQTLLDNVDIIANMNYGFRSDFRNGIYQGSKFRFEQFRLEIKGYVSKKVFFRFRHRYTSDFEPQSVDKIVKGVDFAYIRIDLSEKVQLTVGKTYADWGGWEFDINPVEIYEYSDIIEFADNFLSGVGVYWQATDNHGLSFQILNSRTTTFEALYDTVPDVEESKVPLMGVANWRGSLFDGQVTTLWSYSLFPEAKGVYTNYLALGTQYDSKNGKWHLAYDYKLSSEDLDRTGIISDEIPDDLYNYSVRNTQYQSHWIHLQWFMTKKWSLAFYGFVDFAKWKDDLDPLKTTDDIRKVWTYIPTLEFYPFEDVNLKFFVNYVGRHYNYSQYFTDRVGAVDYSTGRITVGFISPLLVL